MLAGDLPTPLISMKLKSILRLKFALKVSISQAYVHSEKLLLQAEVLILNKYIEYMIILLK